MTDIDLEIKSLEARLSALREKRRRRRQWLEEQSIEGLDVPALLRQRRRLQTTSYTIEREPALQARIAEIDRLLVISASEHGTLRAAVRRVLVACVDLEIRDLDQRLSVQRRCQADTRRAHRLVARLVERSSASPERYHVAREYALKVWQRLVQASDARVRLTRGAIPGTLEAQEHEVWREIYREFDLPWSEESA